MKALKNSTALEILRGGLLPGIGKIWLIRIFREDETVSSNLTCPTIYTQGIGNC